MMALNILQINDEEEQKSVEILNQRHEREQKNLRCNFKQYSVNACRLRGYYKTRSHYRLVMMAIIKITYSLPQPYCHDSTDVTT
jgi:hypothetical protein